MAKNTSEPRDWEFWIDRGGTFTDVIGRSKKHRRLHVTKLLSESPSQYSDASIEGMRRIIAEVEQSSSTNLNLDGKIEIARMGTTIGTNALLQRKGDRCALVTNQGFKDAIKIGYQNRPDIFALDIKLPEMLFETSIELAGRFDAQGNELQSLNLVDAEVQLRTILDAGIKSIAIVFMHAYRFDSHEKQIKELALSLGFEQVSASSEVSPLIRFVSRGDTAVVDAYLTPLLNRYLDSITSELPNTRLFFMQSNGGLTPAKSFRGKDCLLSGPAGGVVGAAKSSALAGYNHVIGFDMGGTSTDVCHYEGQFERTIESEIQGVKIRTPMMAIHTVAAGGGSILTFDGERCRVGPQSAGANPGPASYRNGGPLTVTDANLLLGRIQPTHFPAIFGPTHNQSLDKAIVTQKFSDLSNALIKAGFTANGNLNSPEKAAEGFLKIAVEIMASAIRKISTEKGHDLEGAALCAFGGAGGQHACQIADELKIKTVILHPLAGVLSAFGIGIADTIEIAQAAVEENFNAQSLRSLNPLKSQLRSKALAKLESNGISADDMETNFGVHLRYRGTDAAIFVPLETEAQTIEAFETQHRKRYGFISDKPIVIESLTAEVIARGLDASCGSFNIRNPTAKGDQENKSTLESPNSVESASLFCNGSWHNANIFVRENLPAESIIVGPAIIAETTATTIVEIGWTARTDKLGFLILERTTDEEKSDENDEHETALDPVKLELFSNRLMSIAEEMGIVLQNTSHSVNIKERLDFSCAIFDRLGRLIANAPHIPVHLGSMSESVQSLMKEKIGKLLPGDTFIINNPYLGGTHLPDVTAISPVFIQHDDIKIGHVGQLEVQPKTPDFFVASRGHHADIGGITPGSMPPDSKILEEEGVVFSHFQLISEGRFNESELVDELASAKYPARNSAQNVADLTAQIAANRCGGESLIRLCERYGMSQVEAYMEYVRNNAASSVRRALDKISDGTFEGLLDDGAKIAVTVKVDRDNEKVFVDFSGTTAQHSGNMNAPLAISKAALLYVFRTIVNDNIPLNDGCLDPVEFVIPNSSILNPDFPAAVVAGNVETSQILVDALYGAMDLMAASQGTMNNLTFGNDVVQYYETICGGTGAGANFNGCSAVHSHMTNSRLTDPEVLELRYPVLLRHFGIRVGSGGEGKFKGGDGVVRRIEFLTPMTISILSQRRFHKPFGMHGGKPGQCGVNKLLRKDGSVVILSGTARVEAQAGDCIQIETPGGGGWGAI